MDGVQQENGEDCRQGRPLGPRSRLRVERLRRDAGAFALVERVARQRRVALRDLLQGGRGTGNIALTRQIAMYLLHVLLSRQQDAIGLLFDRERTTVSHAVALIEALREEDPVIDAGIGMIEAEGWGHRVLDRRSCAMSHDAQLQRFVRGLLAGGTAARAGRVYIARDGQRIAAPLVLGLISSGALGGGPESCFAIAETRAWLKRARLDADAFAAQHRVTARNVDGAEINLAESPLARLASASAGEAFLDRHHVEAGERVRRLVERAQLQPRLTMSYSASRTTGGGWPQTVADISDLAAEARREVAVLHRVLPRDCAGVVLDVCGLLKGLQEVERDRGWPRRSAKLVLRIGLEQLAQHYGFGPFAIGRAGGQPQGWMEQGARPERFE